MDHYFMIGGIIFHALIGTAILGLIFSRSFRETVYRIVRGEYSPAKE